MKLQISLGLTAMFLFIAAGTWARVGLDKTLDGVLCLTPVAANSVVAVKLTLMPGEAVRGVRWFNNDGGTAFPRVDLVVGGEDGRPDLNRVIATKANVSGNSLGWSEVVFPVAAGSSERPVFVAFYLPAYHERTDEGVGGGPGFGYSMVEGASTSYVGQVGEGWVQVGPAVPIGPGTQLAVEAMTTGGMAMKAGGDEHVGEEDSRARYETALLPAVPNPANPSTSIHFTLARESHLQLVVYNQRGARVCGLYSGKLPAGDHLLKWRGQDDGGNEVASGVYFVKMVLPDQSYSQRVVIVR